MLRRCVADDADGRYNLTAVLTGYLAHFLFDEYLYLFNADLATAKHAIVTDFTIKIDFPIAALWASYVLVLRLKHVLSQPLSICGRSLQVPSVFRHDVKKIFSQKIDMRPPLHFAPRLPRILTMVALRRHNE